MKKKIVSLVIMLQIVILLIFVVKLISFEDIVYDVPYADYVRTTIPDDRGGWYIDTTFPCEADGRFVYTNDFVMDPGVYQVTVQYESDCSKSYSTVSASTNAYFGLFVDQIPLPNILNEVSYQVYLFDQTNDFSVEFFYGQEGYLIAKDIRIVKTDKLLRMELFIWILLSICIDTVLFGICKYGSFVNLLNEKRTFVFVLLGAIFVSYPIFTGFMRYGVDVGFHLTRIEGLKNELLNGQLPVKMQTIWCYGYGYPVSLYYADLFLGIPALLRIIGFSVQFSYNTFLFIINFATIAIAYWCCHRICQNRIISYVCAMLYTLMPFRLSDLYEGSTLGEAIAMTFIPLIAYGIWAVFTYEVTSYKYKQLWLPLIIGFTGIIQSHILTCVLSGYLIIFVCIIQIKKVFQKERFIVLSKTVIYTSLLNAWFLFPCIFSMDHLDIRQPYRNTIRIQDDGAKLHELFAFWGDGNVNVKGIGFCLGIGLFIYIYLYCKWSKTMRKQGLFFFMMSTLVLFASTVYFPWNKLSSFLGEHSMMINNIQFPSRLLGIAAVLAMFCLCFTLQELHLHNHTQEMKYLACILFVLGLISAEYNIYTGNKFDDVRQVYDYAKLGRTDYCVGEYVYFEEVNHTSTEFIQTKLKINELIPGLVTTSENVEYENYQKEGTATYLTCINNSESQGYVELPLLFYEQYVASTHTEEQLQTQYGNNHLLRVIIPPEFYGDIVVDYKRPVWWRICDIISAIAWIVVLSVLIKNKNYKELEQEKNAYL